MNTLDVSTWEELEEQLNKIVTGNDFIFRGQPDAKWTLVTALDRRFTRPVKAMDYFRLALSAKSQVETLTRTTWEMPEHGELQKWSTDYDNKMKFPYQIPAYSFLIYLRHHGFPSPLLDWTRSRYIAAHFALANTKAERAAIFVYKEYGAAGKVTSSNEPQIVSCGPYVRSHARHFLQQSQYTYCRFFSEDKWYSFRTKMFSAGTSIWSTTKTTCGNSRCRRANA